MPAVTNATEFQAFVGESKATLAELSGKADAQERATADLTRKFQALLERTEKPAAEKQPDGTDVTRFVKADGSIRIRSEKVVTTFAKQPVHTETKGLFDSAPADQWHADLLRLTSARHVYRKLTGNTSSPVLDGRIIEHCSRATGKMRDAVERAISDSAGSGAEWVPDAYSTELYEEYFAPAGIDALFPIVDVPAAGALIIPGITDNIRPYLKGKVTSDNPANYTGSTPTSSSTTITPQGFAALVRVDDSVVEDSIFAMLPELNRRLSRGVRDAYEDAMINGDSAATHQDAIASWNIRSRWGASGLGSSADHRRGFIGFRALAADRSCTVDQASGQTVAKIMEELMGGLGERGVEDAVLIVSPEVFFKKILTDTNMLTVDKAGVAATLLRGQVAQIAGVPVVVSRWMSADLAASGLYTGSGAKSGVIAVSRSEFKHYQRRASLVEMEKEVANGSYALVATLRRSMATCSGASAAVVRYGYNWL